MNKNSISFNFLKLIMLTSMFIGCSSNIYNKPFIDVKETIKLHYGMTKSEANILLGMPLYVEKGDEKTGEIFWIYEVRTRQVKSNLLTDGTVIPNKDHFESRSGLPVHLIRISFLDGKISNWEVYNPTQKDKIEGNKVAQKVKKKSNIKFFFHPTIGLDFESGEYGYGSSVYNDYGNETDWVWREEEYNKRILNFGAHFGISWGNYRIGIDSNFLGIYGGMVTIERLNLSRGLDFIVGGGFNYNELDGLSADYVEHISVGKFGFGKTGLVSGKQVTGRLEFYLHEMGISPSFTIAYHLK